MALRLRQVRRAGLGAQGPEQPRRAGRAPRVRDARRRVQVPPLRAHRLRRQARRLLRVRAPGRRRGRDVGERADGVGRALGRQRLAPLRLRRFRHDPRLPRRLRRQLHEPRGVPVHAGLRDALLGLGRRPRGARDAPRGGPVLPPGGEQRRPLPQRRRRGRGRHGRLGVRAPRDDAGPRRDARGRADAAGLRRRRRGFRALPRAVGRRRRRPAQRLRRRHAQPRRPPRRRGDRRRRDRRGRGPGRRGPRPARRPRRARGKRALLRPHGHRRDLRGHLGRPGGPRATPASPLQSARARDARVEAPAPRYSTSRTRATTGSGRSRAPARRARRP